MDDIVCCEHCGHTWPAEALDQIHDYWSRVDPGGVGVPAVTEQKTTLHWQSGYGRRLCSL